VDLDLRQPETLIPLNGDGRSIRIGHLAYVRPYVIIGEGRTMLSDLPQNISTFGGDIDYVMALIWWIVGAWLVATEAVLLYLLWKYRKKDGKRAVWLPAKTLRANAWVLIPAAIVTVFDLAIEVASARVWAEVKEDIPEHQVLVRITGRQFAWTFQYAGADGELDTPDDFETVGEMHVPRDQIVRFQLEALDVLHAFWVPALRLKQDAVPRRSIPGWFEATKDGDYEIACAEICGAGHTMMRANLTVESPQLFNAWSAAQAAQLERVREVTQ